MQVNFINKMSFIKSLGSLEGFKFTAKAINQVPQDILLEMCEDVGSMLQYKAHFVPLDRYELCLKQRCPETDVDPKLVINGLSHLFRTAAIRQMSSESFYNELKYDGSLEEEALLILKGVWADKGHLLSSTSLNKSFNVGQLIDIQWKLSVGMSTSNCKNLNSPYITGILKSADSFGNASSNSFEMTLAEFKTFATEMRGVLSIMETM